MQRDNLVQLFEYVISQLIEEFRTALSIMNPTYHKEAHHTLRNFL